MYCRSAFYKIIQKKSPIFIYNLSVYIWKINSKFFASVWKMSILAIIWVICLSASFLIIQNYQDQLKDIHNTVN